MKKLSLIPLHEGPLVPFAAANIAPSIDGKLQQLSKCKEVSAWSLDASAKVYAALCHQVTQEKADELIFKHCPSIDQAYVDTLCSIAENRLLPEVALKAPDCALFQRLISTSATTTVQERVVNTKSILVPKRNVEDGKVTFTVGPENPLLVKSAQASVILSSAGKLTQDKDEILRIAVEQERLKNAKKSTIWAVREGRLYINQPCSFGSGDVSRFEAMVRDFYLAVGNSTDDLEKTLQQNTLKRSAVPA